MDLINRSNKKISKIKNINNFITKLTNCNLFSMAPSASLKSFNSLVNLFNNIFNNSKETIN